MAFLFGLSLFSSATAGVVFDGDVSPDNPLLWDGTRVGYVGHASDGSIEVTGGDLIGSGMAYLGYDAGVTGSVTINGGSWDAYGTQFVGNHGNGILRIEGGGSVTGKSNSSSYIAQFSGSSGTVTVSGTGSTWSMYQLYVGNIGDGILTITGGTVEVTSRLYVAFDADATGVVRFGTGGGTLSTQSLYCDATDLEGVGTINARGLVCDMDLLFDATHGIDQTILVNSEPSQNITLNLDLSSVSGPVGDLGVGYRESGTLQIREGVDVYAPTGYLGYGAGSMGTATIDGTGSVWGNSYFYVGAQGEATMKIINGGSVVSNQNYGNSYVAQFSGSSATVTVDGAGSTWANYGKLYVGDSGQGLLKITDGGLVSVEKTLVVDDDADGDSFVNISNGGMLALHGDADDSLTAFFDIIDGTDAIRWWDPVAGGWNSLTTATMGTDYTLAYLNDGSDLDGYTLLTVTAIEPVPGDANQDGFVNASDATILAGNWQAGPGASWLMGDFNGDGYVNASDATILAGNWQATGATSVPEPSTFALLAVLLFMVAAGIFSCKTGRTRPG
ncbi:MAG: dockerin type I domain-containing protein [Planctomycetia bacterium]